MIAVKGQGISEIIPEEEKEYWLIDKGDDARLAELINNYMDKPVVQYLSRLFYIDELVSKYLDHLNANN